MEGVQHENDSAGIGLKVTAAANTSGAAASAGSVAIALETVRAAHTPASGHGLANASPAKPSTPSPY